MKKDDQNTPAVTKMYEYRCLPDTVDPRGPRGKWRWHRTTYRPPSTVLANGVHLHATATSCWLSAGSSPLHSVRFSVASSPSVARLLRWNATWRRSGRLWPRRLVLVRTSKLRSRA